MAASADREQRGVGEPYAERLSSTDVAFLEMESPTRHMHVGGLLLFEPPEGQAPFSFARFLELVRARIHHIPRYRQRVLLPRFPLATAVWVDDPDFDLSYHVRHAALPGPGTTAQLTEYATRILSRQLDRNRPLWELYVIEGLERGRVALLGKTHHAVIDGLAGIDITTVMLDLAPDASDVLPPPEPWRPRPIPSEATLALEAARSLAPSPAQAAEVVGRLARAPKAAATSALEVSRGLSRVARANLLRPAPRSPLNKPPGVHRRFAIQRVPLAEVKAVKDAFQTTVNDVVLAMVADATGRYLRRRGERTEGVWLRAMVPVSTRQASEAHALGNRIVAVFVDLPMFEMDPIQRLKVVHTAMRDVKSSHAAVGAGFLLGLGEFAPPTLHAMAARVAVNARLFNFLVTNVPGPQVPIYCLGSRLLGAFPFTPLAANHAYGVGVTSMDGWLNVGVTADRDVLPDVDEVPALLLAALAELVDSAAAVSERAERLERIRRSAGQVPDELHLAEDGATVIGTLAPGDLAVEAPAGQGEAGP
ncbi:MAG: WS/DGAT/MGAT family O-acyltransferase [Nitriliruptoraceae bacterium]